ncbi:MAG: methionine biosynthesis protein MetW [Elusimicrobiales bacterium]|nr:methionine biosynthesis protein MetW [Elusimicrobiales bacterium]
MKAIFGDFKPDIAEMDYDEYWLAKGKFGLSTRYPVFAALVEPGSSVLDIGCGDGATLSYLSRELAVKGEGIDVSAKAVATAVSRGINARQADASSPGFAIDKNYDYILISEVLEHIPSPEGLIRKVKGRFVKGLILSIPNTGHYLHRLRLLFGRFPVQWAHHPGEHLRFWTLRDFRAWLEWQGLSAADIRVHSGLPVLNRLFPSLFADSLVFLVKARGGG